MYSTAGILTLNILLVLLLGWIAGVLINYLSDVLPTQRKLTTPFCSACKTPLASARALLSYAFWPRRCPVCQKFVGWRSWLVDIGAIAAALWLLNRLPASFDFGMAWVLLVFFGTVTVIDLEHRLILHVVTLTGAVIGIGIGTWLHGWKTTLLGGLGGFFIMLGIYILGIILVQVIARWRNAAIENGEAMGFGDVTLGGVIGLLLGWPGILGGMLMTILLAGLGSLVYMVILLVLQRYRPGMALPHGPFLVASAIILLF